VKSSMVQGLALKAARFSIETLSVATESLMSQR